MQGVPLYVMLSSLACLSLTAVTSLDLAELSQDEWDRDVYTGQHLDGLLLSVSGRVRRAAILVLYCGECEDSLEDLHYSELPPQAYLLYTKHDWQAAASHIPYTLQGNHSLLHRYSPRQCPTVLFFKQGSSIFEPEEWQPEEATFTNWIWFRFRLRLSVRNQFAGSMRVSLAGPGPSIQPVLVHPGETADIESFQSYLLTVTLYQGDKLEPRFVTGRILQASDNNRMLDIGGAQNTTGKTDSKSEESRINREETQLGVSGERGRDGREIHGEYRESTRVIPHADSTVSENLEVDRGRHGDVESGEAGTDRGTRKDEDSGHNTSADDSEHTEGSWLLAAEAAIWRQEDAIRHQQFNLAEVYLAGFKQASLLPKFTQTGVEVRTMPLGLDQALREHYHHHTHLRYHEPFSLSPLVNDRLCKCGIVPLSDDMKDLVFSVLQPLAEDWSRLTLRPTAMYGIREYQRGHVVQPHVDRPSTHVISVLLPIYTDLHNGSHWPLEIRTHHGDRMDLNLNPGEMLLYESASVIHGRPIPLQADLYAVAYVHFQPEFDWLWSEELVGMDNKRFLVHGLNRDFMEPMFVLATDVTKKKLMDMKEEL